MALLGLILLSLSRAGLMLWQAQRVAATGIWLRMLIQGVRVDLILMGILCLPPLLLMPLSTLRKLWPLWRKATFFWVIGAIFLIFLMESATPGFILEYDVRPNRLFVEYLKYPREVVSMLWLGFRLHLVAGVLLTSATVYGIYLLMKPWLLQERRWSAKKVLITWPLVVVLTILTIRSTTGHRPANPALFALTADPMVNSLILNSPWSVGYAVYGLKNESVSSKVYGKMPAEDVFRLTRLPDSPERKDISTDALPTLSRIVPSRKRDKPLNLVIILEESLGATFIGSMGGVPVTPRLEEMKAQGLWFDQMYATGTRSVRGIEAVVAGFLPTPARSVVKLSLSQRNFFTLASLLVQHGYQTEFIYGGESHFDNMRSFFAGNGFKRIIDQDDYSSPSFEGTWGVSDEDLFNRAHRNLTAYHEAGKPFFALVFTSSNHSPFEFPDGRIELFDKEKATENNAVKYADFALGRFFDQARASDYWRDTLFLVVADHDIRVRGDSLVPIERFHIPALILGADVEPRKISAVASQVDLPVTLLSLMGMTAETPMIGRDLSRYDTDSPGRAMMQYDQNYAWMEGEKVVIMRPGKEPVHGQYDPMEKELELVPPPSDAAAMEQRALAHVLLPSMLYREQKYHLPAGKGREIKASVAGQHHRPEALR